MTKLLDLVGRHGRAHADAAGIANAALPGLWTVRATAPSGLVHAISSPLACLVVQGRKRVATGAHEVSFGAGDTLLVAADVPTVSQITRAALAEPYLSLVVELDPALIAALAPAMGPTLITDAAVVQAGTTDEELADVALRLMRLLDRPAALQVLGPGLIREFHYWLLAGRLGTAVQQLGWPDSHARRIGRAVTMMRGGLAESIAVERLAEAAGMSPSSFHQHFKAVTSLSPLQFHKQLRLIEARRMMTGEGRSATSAAFAVGYESVSQFTREYGRLFGVSPAKDAAVARRDAAAA